MNYHTRLQRGRSRETSERRASTRLADPPEGAELSMSELERPCSLLEELDQRQDEVLAQLEDLNGQIENLLRDCLQFRSEHELVIEEERPANRAFGRTVAA